MSRATIRENLGEGGALLDDSLGGDNLIDVIKALAEAHADLDAYQAAVATGVIASKIIDKPTRVHSFRTHVAVCGGSGSTTVQFQVNGVSIASLTTANTDPDGTSSESDDASFPYSLEAGDLVQFVVTAAAGSATGLTASARVNSTVLQRPSS